MDSAADILMSRIKNKTAVSKIQNKEILINSKDIYF